MDAMPHASQARSAAVALALFLATACGGGDPSGPEPPDPPGPPTDLPTQQIETGDTVELLLEATASGAAVTVQPDGAAELAFFVQALEGTVNFVFTDSSSGAALGDGHIPTDAVEANLYRRRTPVVAAAGGQVLQLRLIRNGTMRSRVRLIAYEANPAPELRESSIAPPDTSPSTASAQPTAPSASCSTGHLSSSCRAARGISAIPGSWPRTPACRAITRRKSGTRTCWIGMRS